MGGSRGGVGRGPRICSRLADRQARGKHSNRHGDGMKRIATLVLAFPPLSSWAMSEAFSMEHWAYEWWHWELSTRAERRVGHG